MTATEYLNNSRPALRSKPLDNPERVKPRSADELALAQELRAVLDDLPAGWPPAADGRLPLLAGLHRHSPDGARTATRLLLVAVRVHHWSDERRTAEYLLRHRDEVADGRRTVAGLLSAARCAAEMDARRVRSREVPTDPEALTRRSDATVRARADTPSVADTVVEYLQEQIGEGAASLIAWARLHDAVTVASELAEQLAAHGTTVSIFTMRSDARRGARLSRRLAVEFGDAHAARSLARLLVGGDDAPAETALLWWVAHREVDSADIPQRLWGRWLRDLIDADPAVPTRRARRRRASSTPARRNGSHAAPPALPRLQPEYRN